MRRYVPLFEEIEFPPEFADDELLDLRITDANVNNLYYKIIGTEDGRKKYDMEIEKYPNFTDDHISGHLAGQFLQHLPSSEEYLSEFGLHPSDWDTDKYYDLVKALEAKIKKHLKR